MTSIVLFLQSQRILLDAAGHLEPGELECMLIGIPTTHPSSKK